MDLVLIVASLDDFRMAKDYGVKFVRVGTNIENYKEQEIFINLCKKRFSRCKSFYLEFQSPSKIVY